MINLLQQKLRRFTMIAIVFQFTAVISYAQSRLEGKVTDILGGAITDATVMVVGSNHYTTTDSVGHFALEANKGDLIEISHVEYSQFQFVVQDFSFLTIPLLEAPTMLQEVVVVGYGSSLRKDITGAVARISENDFIQGNVTNPLQQLQGKVAGVVITQPGGDPNGDFAVRIRGATSLEGQPPLVVIDGVAIDDFNRAITTLNPADIESYDILKDASASAIYGSRGANGVILITTKKAKGGRAVVEYNGFVGVERISKTLNLLSVDQWRDAVDSLAQVALNKGGNVDWQKEISQTALAQNHVVSLSGGSEQLNFRGSMGYIKQEGVIINSGKDVITARLMVEQKNFKDKLQVQYGINTSVINRSFLPDQNSTNQVHTGGSDIFDWTLHSLPVMPAFNPDGSIYQQANGPLNPIYWLKEVYSKKRENFFQGSVKADYELVRGLRAGVRGALSRGNDVHDYFYPGVVERGEQSVASKGNFNKQIFSGDVHGNYKADFGKHNLEITGVYEYNKFLNDGFRVNARGFLVPELLNNNLSAATQVTTNDISSYKNEVRLISFLGRAVYNFDDRYLLTANFRRDGSSKFGPDKRWGNFPSVAAAWRASSENFLADVHWLRNLKLRASYGLTGNQENLQPNSFQQLYGPGGPYLCCGELSQSYGVTQENNPDLKWEVRKSFNVGMDFSIVGDRVNVTVDLFSDRTSDMLFLYDLPQPPFLTNRVTANAANAVNKGLETTVRATIVKSNRFTWEANANFSVLRNYVTNLSGQFKGVDLSITNRHYGYANGRGLTNSYISQLEVGYPAGVFWIPEHAGFDSLGYELFHNYDVDGKLMNDSTKYEDKDRVFVDPTPDFTWGLTNSFTFGNFDFSFFLRGVQGQKIFANSLLTLGSTVNLPGSNVTDNALTNGFIKEQPKPSTYWLRNGSYARLQNVSAGYNVRNIRGISKLRLYLVATNLFVLTHYEGLDPEIATEGSQRNIDNNYYPKTRGFTIGVNVAF